MLYISYINAVGWNLTGWKYHFIFINSLYISMKKNITGERKTTFNVIY